VLAGARDLQVGPYLLQEKMGSLPRGSSPSALTQPTYNVKFVSLYLSIKYLLDVCLTLFKLGLVGLLRFVW